jgi:hypothetical protein
MEEMLLQLVEPQPEALEALLQPYRPAQVAGREILGVPVLVGDYLELAGQEACYLFLCEESIVAVVL